MFTHTHTRARARAQAHTHTRTHAHAHTLSCACLQVGVNAFSYSPVMMAREEVYVNPAHCEQARPPRAREPIHISARAR